MYEVTVLDLKSSRTFTRQFAPRIWHATSSTNASGARPSESLRPLVLFRRHIMEKCRKELCARCAIRDWCSHRLDQAANRSEMIRRMVNAANPNFIVR